MSDVPDIGTPEAPSSDMVRRGFHGNGTWPSDPATMAELTERSREVGRTRRQKRIAAFDEKMVEVVGDAADVHAGLIRMTNRILAECEKDGRTPTADEMDVIKRGQKAAEVVPDRVIGKASQKVEHTGQVSLVGLIAGNAQLEEGMFDDEDEISAEWDEEE